MTQDQWLATHPYLQPLADFRKAVDEIASEGPVCPNLPNWNDYKSDFHAGVPLLHSPFIKLELRDAGFVLVTLAKGLSARSLPEGLVEGCRALHSELLRMPDAPSRALDRVAHDGPTEFEPGALLQYLGWTVLARYLRPVLNSFNAWRDDEQWLRNYCPTCGAPPAMAQLVGIDPGRQRMLSCGRCETRWRYRRTACSFCENVDSHRLAVLAVEGEAGLRIDYCEECRGYVKTYSGNGSEHLFLADWTSIHLDVIARDHGLKRFALSLYSL